MFALHPVTIETEIFTPDSHTNAKRNALKILRRSFLVMLFCVYLAQMQKTLRRQEKSLKVYLQKMNNNQDVQETAWLVNTAWDL